MNIQRIFPFVIAILFIYFFSHRSLAQGAASSALKFGYVASEQIVYLMPEAKDIEQKLRMFKEDSIDAVLPYLLSEYNRKDSSSKIEKNSIIKKQMAAEAEQIRQQLQNWNQIAQSRMQQKQGELLEPVYQKVSEAIDYVAKTGKYTYVFRAESLLHAPEGDNLTFKVLDKLGIKIPQAPVAAPTPGSDSKKGK